MYNGIGLPTKDETSETTVLKLFGIFPYMFVKSFRASCSGQKTIFILQIVPGGFNAHSALIRLNSVHTAYCHLLSVKNRPIFGRRRPPKSKQWLRSLKNRLTFGRKRPTATHPWSPLKHFSVLRFGHLWP